MTSPKNIRILRESVVKVVRILASKSIKVTQRGSDAFVRYDEETLLPAVINIPAIPDGASVEYINAIQGFIDHEVGHILYSDQSVIPIAKREKIKTLQNIVEDVFVEAKMTKAFRGSAKNLNHIRELIAGEMASKISKLQIKKGSAITEGDYWAVLCFAAIRAWAGQQVFEELMEDYWRYIPSIASKLVPIKPKLKLVSCSEESLSIAREIKSLIYEPETPEENKPEEKGDEENESPKPPEESGDDEQDSGGEGDTSPEDGDSGDDPDEKNVTEEGEGEESDSSGSPGDNPGEIEDSDESPSAEEQAAAEQEMPKLDMSDLEDFSEMLNKEIKRMALDAIDASDYSAYTTDNDLIETISVSARAEYAAESIEKAVGSMVGPMARQLERCFRVANRSRMRPGLKTGKINSSALARLTVGDTRVFRKKEIEKTKDYAVSLVIDCSGSMEYSDRIEFAIQSAWALADVMNKLKIPTEIVGFTTLNGSNLSLASRDERLIYDRWEKLYMPVFKEWHEPFGTLQKMRLGSYESIKMTNNVDGESIRIAADRLLRRPEPGKAMFVLSDGQPACARTDPRTLGAHLVKVVSDIEKEGVNIIGIGIQTNAVEQFYRKCVVLNEVESLPETVIRELSKVIMAK